MTIIDDPCPACGTHPAERGVLYGIDAIVCGRLPFNTPVLIPDDWLRNLGFTHPMFPLDPDLASIEERCAPELSPPARAWTEVCEALRPEIENELVIRRWQSPWGPGAWVLMRDWSVKYVPPPGPVGPIALVKVCPEPDPCLGEGAVSPTRGLRN